MEIIEIRPGYVRLSAPGGVRDRRNGSVYSTVVCRAKDAKYFEGVSE